MQTPKVVIIADPTNTVSRQCLQRSLPLLDHYGYNYTVFPAVNGYTVTDRTWHSLELRVLPRGKWLSKPGAWGCFVSHYTVWQQCREPIIVLEHDALAQQPWDHSLDLEQCLWKLYKAVPTKLNSITGHWNRGAWAYTLTPRLAQQLIEFSQLNGVQALDKQIGTVAVPWQHCGLDLFQHDTTPRISTTSNLRR